MWDYPLSNLKLATISIYSGTSGKVRIEYPTTPESYFTSSFQRPSSFVPMPETLIHIGHRQSLHNPNLPPQFLQSLSTLLIPQITRFLLRHQHEIVCQ